MSITLVALAIALMSLEAYDVAVVMTLAILTMVDSVSAAMVPLFREYICPLGSTKKSFNH